MRILTIFLFSFFLHAEEVKSPQEYMEELYKVLEVEDWKKLENLLDLRHLQKTKRKNSSMQIGKNLKKIFDSYLQVVPDNLSIDPAGKQNDSLPFYRELIIKIQGNKTKLPIYIDKIKGSYPKGGWKLSPLTINRIESFVLKNKISIIPKFIPKNFLSIDINGLNFWHCLQLLIVIILSIFSSVVFANLGLKLFIPLLVPKSSDQARKKFQEILLPSFRFIFFLLFSFTGPFFLDLPLNAWESIINIYKGLLVIGIFWPIINFIELFDLLLHTSASQNKIIQLRQNIPLGKKSIKVILSIVAILLMLQNWGVDVTAIFAGLGVGGVAVALAGQKTIENFFGGLVLIADRPIKVGDFCEFDGTRGYIEEIGPRSTRIRTLEQTLITIPNGEFSQMKIENWHRRNRIGMRKILNLRYESTPDQLKTLIMKLKKMFIEHEMVEPQPIRIRLVDFGQSSIDMEVYVLVRTTNWENYLAIQEDLMFNTMICMKESGVGFAFPSRSLYLQRDKVSSKEEIDQIVDQFQSECRSQSEQWPNYSNDFIKEHSDKLPYPQKWPK